MQSGTAQLMEKKKIVHGATVISRWLKADGSAKAAAFAFSFGVPSCSFLLFNDFVAPKENASATVGWVAQVSLWCADQVAQCNFGTCFGI